MRAFAIAYKVASPPSWCGLRLAVWCLWGSLPGGGNVRERLSRGRYHAAGTGGISLGKMVRKWRLMLAPSQRRIPRASYHVPNGKR